jgi:hypothetical protein
LKALASRNAFEVRHDSFGGDSELLAAAVEWASFHYSTLAA